MGKNIKRADLIGTTITIMFKDKETEILLTEAHECVWFNPNHDRFHNKKVLRLGGYRDLHESEGITMGKYTRVDILESDILKVV